MTSSTPVPHAHPRGVFLKGMLWRVIGFGERCCDLLKGGGDIESIDLLEKEI
jgi:hypothetical protein